MDSKKDETLHIYLPLDKFWHKSGGDVHHTCLNCSESQKIQAEDRLDGNGHLPFCEECMELELTDQARGSTINAGFDTGIKKP